MSQPTGSGVTTNRLEVRSADGTRLAVWADGDGPALVLVHGAPSDHATFDPLVQELRRDFTTFGMDRRGSGGSGDTLPYAVEREFEDVAAVVDTVAARSGSPVALWGHSYGANPAMGGAARTGNVGHLILYEPSFGLRHPAGSIDAIEAAVASGDREAAIRAALVDTGAMTDAEFDDFKRSPRWPKVLAAAPTLPRECRVEHTWVYRPSQFDGIAADTLLLTGAETDAALANLTHLAAAALPKARIRVLEGHGHFAYKTDPAMVAAIIRDHISS
jgi:pimeloyl-ACP methyl ester carboxylesterase